LKRPEDDHRRAEFFMVWMRARKSGHIFWKTRFRRLNDDVHVLVAAVQEEVAHETATT